MPYNFKADRGKREESLSTKAAWVFLLGMLLTVFFIGFFLGGLERAFYYNEGDNEIDGFSISQVLLSSSTHTFIPTAEAYPYSPYSTYNYYNERTKLDNYGFALYDYEERPTYWETWEVSIDWEDPDNWSTITGKPIIDTYSYKVTRNNIIAYDDYNVDIVIFTQCKYWVDTFIYGC